MGKTTPISCPRKICRSLRNVKMNFCKCNAIRTSKSAHLQSSTFCSRIDSKSNNFAKTIPAEVKVLCDRKDTEDVSHDFVNLIQVEVVLSSVRHGQHV